MTESLFISIIGWGVGTLLSLILVSQKISTLNFSSFSEVEFGFSLNGSILISSFLFAVFMGLLGGFLPSVRAARLNIVNALRAG
jgi:ABC-type antimicrobial peptide transport system permease subunit